MPVTGSSYASGLKRRKKSGLVLRLSQKWTARLLVALVGAQVEPVRALVGLDDEVVRPDAEQVEQRPVVGPAERAFDLTIHDPLELRVRALKAPLEKRAHRLLLGVLVLFGVSGELMVLEGHTEAAAAVLDAVLDVAHLAIALAHVDAVVIRALVFVGPARAPVAAAVPPAVRVGRARGAIHLSAAPAHGARKRPLVADPHHHVRLVVVLLVEHDVARAEGGVGDVGGAFLDLLLFAQLRALRAPRGALGRNGRAGHAVATQPVVARQAFGLLLARGAAARLRVLCDPAALAHRALGTKRPVRAPLDLALGAHLPLAAVLAAVRLVDSLCRLVALGALAPNIATRNHAPEPLFLFPRAQVRLRSGLASHSSLISFSGVTSTKVWSAVLGTPTC